MPKSNAQRQREWRARQRQRNGDRNDTRPRNAGSTDMAVDALLDAIYAMGWRIAYRRSNTYDISSKDMTPIRRAFDGQWTIYRGELETRDFELLAFGTFAELHAAYQAGDLARPPGEPRPRGWDALA